MKKYAKDHQKTNNWLPALTLLHQPLTEEDILKWHELFLIEGFHALPATVREARAFITVLLESMNYHSNIGYLALEQIDGNEFSPIKYHDILQELMQGNHLGNPYDFYEYFLDTWDYDFCWIELTTTLVCQKWYSNFYHTLVDLQLYHQLPIIIVESRL